MAKSSLRWEETAGSVGWGGGPWGEWGGARGWTESRGPGQPPLILRPPLLLSVWAPAGAALSIGMTLREGTELGEEDPSEAVTTRPRRRECKGGGVRCGRGGVRCDKEGWAPGNAWGRGALGLGPTIWWVGGPGRGRIRN